MRISALITPKKFKIYITSALIAVVPRIKETVELTGTLQTAAGLNGLALLITALVQTRSRQLDLYHAIVILVGRIITPSPCSS